MSSGLLPLNPGASPGGGGRVLVANTGLSVAFFFLLMSVRMKRLPNSVSPPIYGKTWSWRKELVHVTPEMGRAPPSGASGLVHDSPASPVPQGLGSSFLWLLKRRVPKHSAFKNVLIFLPF